MRLESGRRGNVIDLLTVSRGLRGGMGSWGRGGKREVGGRGGRERLDMNIVWIRGKWENGKAEEEI